MSDEQLALEWEAGNATPRGIAQMKATIDERINLVARIFQLDPALLRGAMGEQYRGVTF
jgi:hypothetical protein